jgi:hypothetical protein
MFFERFKEYMLRWLGIMTLLTGLGLWIFGGISFYKNPVILFVCVMGFIMNVCWIVTYLKLWSTYKVK